MPKVPKLKEANYKKFKKYIRRLGKFFLVFFTIPLFLICIYFFIFKERCSSSIFLVFIVLYWFIISEIDSFNRFKKYSNLKNLESKIDKNIADNIPYLTYILIFYFFSSAKINIIIFLFVVGPIIVIFDIFFSEKFYHLFHFNLKRKVELSVYTSLEEVFIISLFPFIIDILNGLYLNLISYLSIQSPEYFIILKNLLLIVVILIASIVNIQVNSWRIDKRLKHIISLKTKDLKKERDKIIKTIKNISDSALKKKDNKEQWRRNEILKTRLSCIESEINKISNEYTSKPNYLSKIPVLVAMIYAMFEIFMKIFEILHL